MEQKPMHAAEPLPQPSADIARAYLDEITTVQQRREERIDRRGMAKVSLAEAIVLAVYLTVLMFTFGTEVVSSSFMILIAVFLLWLQLVSELKESYGFQARMRSRERVRYVTFGVLVIAAAVVGIALANAGVELPLFLHFAPGLLVLAIFGGMAVRDLRRTSPGAELHPRGRFTSIARFVTGGIGVLIGASIWASVWTSIVDPLAGSVFSMVVMFAILGWFIALQISRKLPALGAQWRWPQWSALAIGWGALAIFVLLQLHTDVITAPTGAVVGAGVAALFVAVAFVGGRGAHEHRSEDVGATEGWSA